MCIKWAIWFPSHNNILSYPPPTPISLYFTALICCDIIALLASFVAKLTHYHHLTQRFIFILKKYKKLRASKQRNGNFGKLVFCDILKIRFMEPKHIYLLFVVVVFITAEMMSKYVWDFSLFFWFLVKITWVDMSVVAKYIL